MTNTEIENRLIKVETAMSALVNRMDELSNKLAMYATHGQLSRSEANTKNIINDNSILINNLQQKLLTISIPDDTKYYLSNTEIESFRNNYKKLIAMMSDSERLYQALIAYTAQVTTANASS